MTNAQLVSYVRDQLKAGYAPDEVRNYLVGYGYPVRDVEEAIEQARKLPAIPIPQLTEKKFPQTTPEKTIGEDFVEMFKTWFTTLFMPGQVFPNEKDRATLPRAFMNLFVSAAFGGLISGLIYAIMLLLASPVTPFEGIGLFGLAPIITVQKLTTTPIAALFAWIGITGFFYLFSIILGEKGQFERFAYYTSLIAAPIIIILTILPAFLPKCANFYTVVVFGALGVYPMVYAVKETHETNFAKAAMATFMPIVLFGVLMVPAFLRFATLYKAICP